MSVSVIELILDPAFLDLWRVRHTFKRIVIINRDGEKSKTVDDLIAVLMEVWILQYSSFDWLIDWLLHWLIDWSIDWLIDTVFFLVVFQLSSDPIKIRPMLLTNGFYGFSIRFPQSTTNPQHEATRVEIPRQRMKDVSYPFFSAFTDRPAPPSPEALRKTPEIPPIIPRSGAEHFQDLEKRKSLFPRPKSGEYSVAEPVPFSVIPDFESVAPTPISVPDRSSGLYRSRATPAVNREVKPSLSGISSVVEPSGTASKPPGVFDDVLSNPNVTVKRGSTEIIPTTSEDELEELSGNWNISSNYNTTAFIRISIDRFMDWLR